MQCWIPAPICCTSCQTANGRYWMRCPRAPSRYHRSLPRQATLCCHAANTLAKLIKRVCRYTRLATKRRVPTQCRRLPQRIRESAVQSSHRSPGWPYPRRTRARVNREAFPQVFRLRRAKPLSPPQRSGDKYRGRDRRRPILHGSRISEHCMYRRSCMGMDVYILRFGTMNSCGTTTCPLTS